MAAVGIVTLLAIAMFPFSEQHARAEDCFAGGAAGLYLAAGGVAAAVAVPFLVADVVYTVEGQWLPPGWATTQIVLGGGVNAAVAVLGMTNDARRLRHRLAKARTRARDPRRDHQDEHSIASRTTYRSAP